MTCPNCGSELAVSKVEAWDAACATPPKAEAELKRLQLVEMAARAVAADPPTRNSEDVLRYVKLNHLNALRSALGLEAI
jgi:hypothetical protein